MDVMKSVCECIASSDPEDSALGCLGIQEAAAIGLEHPKWGERPLLVCVRKTQATVTAEDVLAFLDGKIASWWRPDAVEFVDEIPHTATGKISKLTLRERFRDYRFPGT